MPQSSKLPDTSVELLQAAERAASRAYCPYSGFPVGAAVLAADGRIFDGCNIENASYGLAICAERVALFNAVAAGARKSKGSRSRVQCVTVHAAGQFHAMRSVQASNGGVYVG